MVPSRICALLFLICSLALPRGASAQIYADVTITGTASGTFTISLEYQKAPAAVANFIGLATGKKAWLDQNTGSIRNDPFYNGVTFHRVIAGFMSQTGSRAGDGTDGPGYSFRNEIDSTLTHATPYTVAMANSGGAYSNGSQWYVTAGNGSPTHLDGVHTIFGVVTAGTAICDAINGSPSSSVTISSITIYGPSYASFNLAPDALPKVLNGRPVMNVSGTNYSLGYDHKPFSYYYGYDSPDLTNWLNFRSTYSHSAAPPAGDLNVTNLVSGSRHFFKLARVDFGLCYNPYIPDSLASKTIHFSSPLAGSVVVNSAGTGGTWAFDGSGSSPLAYYSYSPYPFWGNLVIQLSNGFIFAIDRLEWTSATGGNYTGRTNVIGFSNITGTFTSMP